MTAGVPQLDFVAVGPQKTATSWLHQALAGAEGVVLPRDLDETFFFDREWHRGLEWYDKLWRGAGPGLRGEFAPTCFEHPEAPARIASVAPQARIVVTLRDPVLRLWSLYLHERRKARVKQDFLTAIVNGALPVAGSHYRMHLPRWLERFGSERVLILLQEDIKCDPQRALHAVGCFLDVAIPPEAATTAPANAASLPRFPLLAHAVTGAANVARGLGMYRLLSLGRKLGLRAVYRGGGLPEPPSPVMLGELAQRFADDIAYVERVLARDLVEWRHV